MTEHNRSQRLYEHAAVIPGRSMTRSKAPGRFFDVGVGPLYAQSAKGCRIRDVDGDDYIDMLCGLGAISVGYGRHEIVTAAAESIQQGWLLSLPHAIEVRAAEAVLELVAPWASHVRFTKTGSEATHAALLVAQRATRRKSYLRSRASYHGWHTVWQPDAQDVRWFDDGQPMGGLADGCCAIFVEPPRWTPCTKEWLSDCRDEAARAGALLVFDEMIFGGRWTLGGATEYFDVTPDLACYGKAIGNGAPVACVVGGAALAAHGELVSGTYSGDVAALAAVIETLKIYQHEAVIETLWKRGRQLRRGLCEARDVYNNAGGPLVACEGEPVHQRLRFMWNGTENVLGYHNVDIGRQFAAAMVKRGVLWHPDVVNVCAAHTEADIEHVVEAAILSMQEMTR